MWLACHWTGWFYISDLGRRPSRHGGLLESSGWRNTKPFSKGGHEWSRRVTTSDPCSDCSVGLWKVTSHKYVLQLVHNLPSDFPDSKAPCFGIWRFRKHPTFWDIPQGTYTWSLEACFPNWFPAVLRTNEPSWMASVSQMIGTHQSRNVCCHITSGGINWLEIGRKDVELNDLLELKYWSS